MRAGLPDGDGGAQGIALRHPDAQLQLIVEASAGFEDRHLGVRRLALAARAHHGLAAGAHRRGAAMIADRHIFVVGQQRIVGAEQLADIGGMMDADIEIGVIADPRGQMQRDRGAVMQRGFDVFAIALVAQKLRQALAQLIAILRRQGEEIVEGRLTRRASCFLGQEARDGGQIEHALANGDADALLAPRRRKHAQRQVLDRKFSVAIGRGDPACQAGLMGVVDLGQGHCAAPERGT